jgi:hypothetical protein
MDLTGFSVGEAYFPVFDILSGYSLPIFFFGYNAILIPNYDSDSPSAKPIFHFFDILNDHSLQYFFFGYNAILIPNYDSDSLSGMGPTIADAGYNCLTKRTRLLDSFEGLRIEAWELASKGRFSGFMYKIQS